MTNYPFCVTNFDSPLRFLGKKFCCSDYFVYFCIIIKPKRMTIRQRFYLLTASLLMYLSVYPQIDSKLTYRRYTTQDGLPQLQAERLWQDSRGYIYIGTLSGFVRYDGREFTPFLKGRRENIVGFTEYGGQVRALGFRRQWIVGWDEVEMKPVDASGQWLLNNFNGGSLPDGYFILEDEKEENRRLCLLTAWGFIPVARGVLLDQMTPDRKLYKDSSLLYVPTAQGLYRVAHNRAVRLTVKRDVFTLLRTADGLLAFASDGIYIVGSRELTMKTPFAFESTSYGLVVRQQANGHLVIADEHSVYDYDGEQVRQIATGINLIKDLLVDRWDRLWVATYEGLYCYFNRNFTSHQLTDRNDIIRAIGVDAEDRLVMGTLNGKLLIDGRVVENHPARYFAPCTVTVGGRVYLIGDGGVLCGDSASHWLRLPRERYKFVAQAGRRLVVGSHQCIAAYDPQTDALDTLATNIPYPWCAALDASGHLWVGGTFGLYADGQKTGYRQQLIVTAMERDAQGNIIFASKDSLFLIRNGVVESLPMPALSGHEVRSLHISPKGFLVVAVIDGLFVSRIGQDYTLSDVRFFNHTNGFTTLEPQMATIAETADGTVWLAGIEETTSFRPADLLAYDEHDTYIKPSLRWWQHWWVWVAGLVLLALAVWAATRRYEMQRNRRRIFRLQREKLQREEQIEAIRQKAIEKMNSKLAKDIVKMTEKKYEQRITLRTARGTIIVDVKDIAYFKGDGNYSQIVTFQSQNTVLMGLGALEKLFMPSTA